MPHIHTQPGQHDLTTTAFIIRYDGDVPRALLHPHRKLNMLLPVGGHVELHENPWQAVIHEIAEESGYDIQQLSVLQPRERITQMTGTKIHPAPLFLQTHQFKKNMDHFHVDVGFAFVTNELPSKQPADGEEQELLWLTLEELQNKSSEMPADIVDIYKFCFELALQNWEHVNPRMFDA